jgi:hypothetical protein
MNHAFKPSFCRNKFTVDSGTFEVNDLTGTPSSYSSFHLVNTANDKTFATAIPMSCYIPDILSDLKTDESSKLANLERAIEKVEITKIQLAEAKANMEQISLESDKKHQEYMDRVEENKVCSNLNSEGLKAFRDVNIPYITRQKEEEISKTQSFANSKERELSTLREFVRRNETAILKVNELITMSIIHGSPTHELDEIRKSSLQELTQLQNVEIPELTDVLQTAYATTCSLIAELTEWSHTMVTQVKVEQARVIAEGEYFDSLCHEACLISVEADNKLDIARSRVIEVEAILVEKKRALVEAQCSLVETQRALADAEFDL